MKYRNIKVTVDGFKFDSILESQVYAMLKKNPNLKILELQPKVYLTEAKILCKPDFKVQNIIDGMVQFVEAKGHETAIWRLKRRLWVFYGTGPLSVYMKKGSRIILKEVLTPR